MSTRVPQTLLCLQVWRVHRRPQTKSPKTRNDPRVGEQTFFWNRDNIFSNSQTSMEDPFFSFSKKVIFSWKNLVRRKSEKHKLCHGGRGRSCGNQIPWLEIPREKPETTDRNTIFVVLWTHNAKHLRLSLHRLFHWFKLQSFSLYSLFVKECQGSLLNQMWRMRTLMASRKIAGVNSQNMKGHFVKWRVQYVLSVPAWIALWESVRLSAMSFD